MDKKIWIAVVIAAFVLIGVFLATKVFLGNKEAITGKLTEEIPEKTGEKLISASKFSEIKEEMTKSQVISLVGEPIEKQTIKTPRGNTIEYWYYEDSNKDVWQIGFSEEKVSVVRKY